MRGGLWSLAVVAVGVGVLLRVAVGEARPPNPAAGTQEALGVLSQLEPVAGLLMLAVGLGAFASYTFGRGF